MNRTPTTIQNQFSRIQSIAASVDSDPASRPREKGQDRCPVPLFPKGPWSGHLGGVARGVGGTEAGPMARWMGDMPRPITTNRGKRATRSMPRRAYALREGSLIPAFGALHVNLGKQTSWLRSGYVRLAGGNNANVYDAGGLGHLDRAVGRCSAESLGPTHGSGAAAADDAAAHGPDAGHDAADEPHHGSHAPHVDADAPDAGTDAGTASDDAAHERVDGR